MSFATFSLLAALAATVSAHGYVDNATIAGVEYTGYQPYQDPYTSPLPERIFRPIQGNGPVEDLTSIDIQCGGYTAGGIVGSSPANLTGGPVAAGSDVELKWTLWPESHMGPVITYMALCPSNDCASYVPGTDAVWFKVQEAGRTGTTDVWGATPLMTTGSSVSYTIPSCLAAGSYLVRHEIIALHAAYAYPGAQFYPSCHQIEVTSSGSSSGPATKVAFPGAYASTDAGIMYDAYKASEYTIPGPALFTCDGSSDSGSSTPVVSSGVTSSAVASSTATVFPVSSAVATSSAAAVETSTFVTTSASVKTSAAASSILPSTLQTLINSSSSAAPVATTALEAVDDC